MEQRFGEPWIWKSGNTKPRCESIQISFISFEEMIAFSILFNGLESSKPLVTKFQKQNSDIYQTYQMNDQVVQYLKYFRKNIETELGHWYSLEWYALEVVTAVGGKESKARAVKYFQ